MIAEDMNKREYQFASHRASRGFFFQKYPQGSKFYILYIRYLSGEI